jgi:hypothetical protein
MRTARRLPSLLPFLALVCVSRTPLALAQAVGPEFRVNSYTTSGQYVPSVATDSGGNFVIVWESAAQDGSLLGVFGQRYESTGAPLGGEFRVNTFTTNYQVYPSVASDPNGNFVVVWESAAQDGSLRGVFGQRYGSTGAPLGAEFRVNTLTTNSQFRPSAASDSGGNFVVVWATNTQNGPGLGVFGQRYGSTGAPLGAEFRVSTFTTSVSSPRVASDSVGNLVVAWPRYYIDPGWHYGVFAQRYSSMGAPRGPEFGVNTYPERIQFSPSVASDSSGNFVVVWDSGSNPLDFGDVFGQRYDSAGASLGVEFRVNTYTTADEIRPSVASDSDGNFVVVWHSYQDGSSYGVLGQRYDSAGAPLGAEFRVNTYTTNYQRYPSVARHSGGAFIVVWQSSTQDGSSLGVFGQRFCPALGSVTVSVNGTTTACTTSTGGTASVTDTGGGARTHQWGFRTTMGGATTPIGGQTGTSYLINGANFGVPPGTPGFYYLVCFTNPECGSPTFSNEIVVIVAADMTPPAVAPPAATTTTQTLCM